MLDTNLWAYIGDQAAGERVKRLMRARGHRAVSPPSVLLEVLQHPLDEKRAAIVRALVTTTDERLRTEADVGAAEVVAEARRLRPGWVRALPDSGREATWRTSWTKQVWRRAVEHHERFRQTKPFEQRKREVEHIVAAQRETRHQAFHANFSLTDLAGSWRSL
ncbi:hypothetical protein ABZZ36_41705 [Actinacidiphila glaucinigra]|uniref:hypothetical protein n=1 Tax=Actinacidiphila glaucinigra TaxID=235986 RepID=UPI0033B0B4DF